MSTQTLSQRLRELRHGLFPDAETVNAVLDECIAQAEEMEGQAGELSDEEIAHAYCEDEPYTDFTSGKAHGIVIGLQHARDHYLKPSQAIGDQTPVAKPNDWSNPEFRAKTFLERMLRMREDLSGWQGKCAVLRHENNRLRARLSAISKEA